MRKNESEDWGGGQRHFAVCLNSFGQTLAPIQEPLCRRSWLTLGNGPFTADHSLSLFFFSFLLLPDYDVKLSNYTQTRFTVNKTSWHSVDLYWHLCNGQT